MVLAPNRWLRLDSPTVAAYVEAKSAKVLAWRRLCRAVMNNNSTGELSVEGNVEGGLRNDGMVKWGPTSC